MVFAKAWTKYCEPARITRLAMAQLEYSRHLIDAQAVQDEFV